MAERFQGLFPVLQTPVGPGGEIEVDSLRREVDFCVQAGAHGLVFPVLGSEFQFLTDTERRQLVEVVIKQAAGRIPVVAGAAGTVWQVAAEHARHAAGAGADAVIALPPYLSGGTRAEIRQYYEAVAKAAGIPVFIQHSQAGMDASLLAELLSEVEHIRYIKEEMHPSAHQISAVVQGAGEACWGVFGGAHDRWMLSELRRGATGFMPAVEAVDVHVQVWEAWQAGDQTRARQVFNQLLPLINLILIMGLPVCKEVLVRRGVFKSAALRTPGTLGLDAEDHRELDAILEGIRPLFRV
ncbi:MAG: dihydrodipicolinate synthase family protein [Candidatus Latescibacteria bacterium]|nr:dihydrodipicolinate synthase family protein [Candidatus Latescibacterota bacterium]